MLDINFVQFELQTIITCTYILMLLSFRAMRTSIDSLKLAVSWKESQVKGAKFTVKVWKGILVSLQFIASPPASSRGGGLVGREKMTSIFFCRSTSFGIWFILKGCTLVFLVLIFLLFVWIYFVIFYLLAWWTSARRMQLWWQHTDGESARFAQCLSHPNGIGGLGIKGKLF